MDDHDTQEKAAATFILGTIISFPFWMLWVFHRNDSDSSPGVLLLSALALTAIGFAISSTMAPVTLFIAGLVIRIYRNIVAKVEQRKLDESMRQLDADNQTQTKRMGVAQSKQEIVTRLGTIDQFIRVYRMEKEPGRQVIALQAAHAEVTSLNGKFVSGEMDRESLSDPHVMACAKETIGDLAAAGLSGDRLTRDLRRIFSLGEVA